MRYKIGTKFEYYGNKHNKGYTIVDCHKTTNMAGETVKTVYIGEQSVFGQTVKKEFPESAIARSKVIN